MNGKCGLCVILLVWSLCCELLLASSLSVWCGKCGLCVVLLVWSLCCELLLASSLSVWCGKCGLCVVLLVWSLCCVCVFCFHHHQQHTMYQSCYRHMGRGTGCLGVMAIGVVIMWSIYYIYKCTQNLTFTSLSFGHNVTSFSTTAKNLGFHFIDDMRIDAHVQDICRKVFTDIRCINSIRHLLSIYMMQQKPCSVPLCFQN